MRRCIFIHGYSLLPVAVAAINRVTAVSAGDGQTCALLSAGSIQCWGLDADSTTGSSVPVTVSGINNAIAVAAGDYTCTVVSSGTVQCWGWNPNGQLGNGTTSDSSAPTTVTGILNAVTVAVGGYHTCASLRSGTVQCWGESGQGLAGLSRVRLYDFGARGCFWHHGCRGNCRGRRSHWRVTRRQDSAMLGLER